VGFHISAQSRLVLRRQTDPLAISTIVLPGTQKVERMVEGAFETCHTWGFPQLTVIDAELKQLLSWLSISEPHAKHQDIRSGRFEETGTWILRAAEFRAWSVGGTDVPRVLACYGIPGAGKTVIRWVVPSQNTRPRPVNST